MRSRIDPQISRPDRPSGPDVAPLDEFDMIEPIRAGMRARSIVENCDALTLPTIFLDGTGRVLHVGRWAGSFLGSAVRIVADHLVGDSDRINRDIQVLLNAALAVTATSGDTPSVVIADDDGSAGMSITAHRCDDLSPYQMLKTVLVFSHRKSDVISVKGLCPSSAAVDCQPPGSSSTSAFQAL